MIEKLLLREEDYWLIPLSIIAIVMIAACLYAGVLEIQLIAGLLGFSGLWFTTYIIRRGYDKKRSYAHIFICLVFAIVLAASAYFLTN